MHAYVWEFCYFKNFIPYFFYYWQYRFLPAKSIEACRRRKKNFFNVSSSVVFFFFNFFATFFICFLVHFFTFFAFICFANLAKCIDIHLILMAFYPIHEASFTCLHLCHPLSPICKWNVDRALERVNTFGFVVKIIRLY